MDGWSCVASKKMDGWSCVASKKMDGWSCVAYNMSYIDKWMDGRVLPIICHI